MDRRQQKTRHAILTAFGALLRQKPFNHITVQEIIDRANVGRSTFYAHFETKDALLQALCADIFAHVFGDSLTREADHDFSDAPADLADHLTHMLYHLRDSADDLRGLLSGESGHLFFGFLREALVPVFDEAAKTRFPGVPADYALDFLVVSFSETLSWWLSGHEATHSPEDISAYYLRVTGLEGGDVS